MSASDLALSVRGLSKSYTIAHQHGENHSTLAESMLALARNPFKRAEKETFWALKDISFDIKKGDVVGIIGRNGAGKSTLLKILSRITEPTTGEIDVYGRIGSLLEVGTGFHPELTGRENIFLNGAILGMSKAEMRKQFDAIVNFAGVEKFLDTPVKRYSSGMYVRLAFSVAAHLNIEMLIVDEVLAVGDVAFQKKCLGRMGEVARLGRTVLFVSHNMSAVTHLCQRAILLANGGIISDGEAAAISAKYLQFDKLPSSERNWTLPDLAPGDDVARLKAIRVMQCGQVVEIVDIRFAVTVEIEYWNLKDNARLLVGANFFHNDGTLLFLTADFQETEWNGPRSRGIYVSRCIVPGNFFAEGVIRILAEVCTREPFWVSHVREMDVVSFNVIDNGEPGSVRAGWARNIEGVVRPMLKWTTQAIQS